MVDVRGFGHFSLNTLSGQSTAKKVVIDQFIQRSLLLRSTMVLQTTAV